MVEKRGPDGDADVVTGSDKKPRVDDGSAPKKPTLSLEALERAKKALQLQKLLKEKLKNLPQVPCNRGNRIELPPFSKQHGGFSG